MKSVKKAVWIGDSLKNGGGYVLHLVQEGITPKNAKSLKGFKPAVMEIISDYDTNTYRSVYTVKLGDTVYILHCFKKKSKSGIKTPKQELELIRQRLRDAEVIYKSKG